MTKKRIYQPDPFEIAVAFTLVVLALASALTEHSVSQNLSFWGEGLWSLLQFMAQMCLILLGGYVIAVSRPMSLGLEKIAKIPDSAWSAYWLTFLVSVVCCLINWGLGLVAGAFFALEVARQNSKTYFPLLVATSYMGFIFWHGGLSGSIPLVVNTPGNFSEKWLGDLMGFDQTLFSSFNLSLILCLFFSLSLLITYFAKQAGGLEKVKVPAKELATVEPEQRSRASKFFYFSLLTFIALYLGPLLISGKFSMGLNQVNLCLIFIGLILHGSLSEYKKAAHQGCEKLAPILIQYPLYAGIMGVIIHSGLAVKISDTFISFSSETTYPLYMFLSAGLVNLFVPSGGGQWAVQAPVVIAGAKELGVPLWKVVMAVSWGDAWTNLAQPFWALPLLSIVGLGLRDIMAYCLAALVVSGLVISSFFLFF